METSFVKLVPTSNKNEAVTVKITSDGFMVFADDERWFFRVNNIQFCKMQDGNRYSVFGNPNMIQNSITMSAWGVIFGWNDG